MASRRLLGGALEPASRGEPFTTEDGWTVRVEKLALQVNVSATPTDNGSEGRYYGSSEAYRFDAPIGIAVEALFQDERTHALRFDDFAAVDADADGIISGPELSTAACTRCDDLDNPGFGRFFDTLRTRSGGLFVPR